jgi:hypothetical protein
MRISKRSLYFIIIVAILTIGNLAILLLAFQLFPTHGGFSRTIIFIKPDSNNTGGYFIILDELSPEAQKYDIDWLLHSRGDVSIHSNHQSFTSTVKSYITNNDISLNVSYLENILYVTQSKGYFLPEHYNEPYYDDLETNQTKATYSGRNKLMATVLYPKNDSDITQNFPSIIKYGSGLRKIGANDFLFYTYKKGEVNFTNPTIDFNGEMFFIRRNNTNTTLLEYYFLQNAESLTFESTEYLSITNLNELFPTPPINILATYSNSSQISGYINSIEGKNLNITLYCNFTAEMLKFDGVNQTFYQTDSKVTFSINGPASFVISSTNNYTNRETDPLRIETPARVKPEKNVWGFDENLITNLQHPYILFNQTELDNLKLKIQDVSKPWNSWYNSYNLSVKNIGNPGDIPYESRYYNLFKLVLSFAIDGGLNTLNKIKQFLNVMGPIQNYSQDLARANAVQAYAMAYDIIYNNLTQTEKNTYSQYLYEGAYPLTLMDLYSDNNHRVVDAGGLGLAGLALKNKTMIDIAIDTILIYYYTNVREDGGSYEGYSYNAYAINNILMFITSLKRLSAFNFYTDPQIIATFDFNTETLGPIGMPNLYEDCSFSSEIHENFLIGAAQFNDTDPIRAQRYQYMWEQRNITSTYPGASTYGYLNVKGPSFELITCYNVNDTITAAPFSFRKEIWKESSMAFLRSDDIPEALFLSFSSKDYRQAHNHLDENSFELWAYGALLVNNPGYPGFGKKYHDWSIKTEASNTLLINGAGQNQMSGGGLTASVSSPYLSMVIGQANEIYNDLSAPQYAPEFYFLIILNFVFTGIACILYIQISKSKTTSTEKNEKEKPEKDLSDRSLSKLKLIGTAFIHPNQAQDYIYHNDPFKEKAKTVSRFIILLICALMALFYILLILDIKSMLDYHGQYYQYKYQWIYDMLPIIALAFVIIGSILTISFSLFCIWFYKRMNRMLTYQSIKEERISITKKQISSVSSMSLIWIFPTLIFSFFLLYFTTANSIKTEIHLIFTVYGSAIGIYGGIISFLLELIRNFYIILIFGIPFNILMLYIFSHGINLNSDNQISKKTSWKISLTSLLLLLVIAFTLYLLIYIGVKLIFTIISIEAFVGG